MHETIKVDIIKDNWAVHREPTTGEVREFKIVGIRIKNKSALGSNFYDTRDKFYKACAVPGTDSMATVLTESTIELN